MRQTREVMSSFTLMADRLIETNFEPEVNGPEAAPRSPPNIAPISLLIHTLALIHPPSPHRQSRRPHPAPVLPAVAAPAQKRTHCARPTEQPPPQLHLHLTLNYGSPYPILMVGGLIRPLVLRGMVPVAQAGLCLPLPRAWRLDTAITRRRTSRHDAMLCSHDPQCHATSD
jgi:hypothetical protein